MRTLTLSLLIAVVGCSKKEEIRGGEGGVSPSTKKATPTVSLTRKDFTYSQAKATGKKNPDGTTANEEIFINAVPGKNAGVKDGWWVGIPPEEVWLARLNKELPAGHDEIKYVPMLYRSDDPDNILPNYKFPSYYTFWVREGYRDSKAGFRVFIRERTIWVEWAFAKDVKNKDFRAVYVDGRMAEGFLHEEPNKDVFSGQDGDWLRTRAQEVVDATLRSLK